MIRVLRMKKALGIVIGKNRGSLSIGRISLQVKCGITGCTLSKTTGSKMLTVPRIAKAGEFVLRA